MSETKRAYYETHEAPHCPTCGCGLEQADQLQSVLAEIERLRGAATHAYCVLSHYDDEDAQVAHALLREVLSHNTSVTGGSAAQEKS